MNFFGEIMKRFITCLFIFIAVSLSVFSQNYTRSLMLKKERMNGDDVQAIQKKLIDLGFLPSGEDDGWFGPKTKLAVQEFQLFYNLESDGIAGRKTFTAMFNETSNQKYDSYMKKIIPLIIRYSEDGTFYCRKDSDTGVTDENLSVALDLFEFPDRYKITENQTVFLKQYWRIYEEEAPSVYIIENKEVYKMSEGKLVVCESGEASEIKRAVSEYK